MLSELLTFALLVFFSVLFGVVLDVPTMASLLIGAMVWIVLQFLRLSKLRRLLPDDGVAGEISRSVWGDVYRFLGSLKREKGQDDAPGWRVGLEESMAGLPYGFVIVLHSGHIEWFNAAAARLLNLSRPDDIGREIHHLVRQPEFDAALAGRAEQAEVELEAGGRRLEAHVSVFGNGAYRLICVQDLSYVRYLECARSEMLGNVAHELKTPLTVIKGYAEIISTAASALADAKIPEAANHVARQAERMNRMIDDLLTLERLDETRLPTGQAEKVNLRNLADEIVEEMAVVQSDKQCKIKIDIAEDAVIHGRPQELRSVLSNLIANAMRYSPASGVVRVSWFHDAGGGHLFVSDQGLGIEAVHLSRLTERFYRADKSRSRELGGTGLGLAIVKRVLQRHGASLRIESELGKGSVFYCDFPLTSLTGSSHSGRATGIPGSQINQNAR